MGGSSPESPSDRDSSRHQPGLVAVLIGIDGYDRAKVPSLTPLSCATNDVISLAETLGKLWQPQYRLTSNTIVGLKREGYPKQLLRALEPLADVPFPSRQLLHQRLCQLLVEGDLRSHVPVLLQGIEATRFVSLTALVLPRIGREESSDRGVQHLRQTWGVDVQCDLDCVTSDSINEAVAAAAELACPSDTLLLFFAGHGQLVDGQPCLVTIDDPTEERGDCLRVADLQMLTERSHTGNRILILDCCQTTDARSRTFFDALAGLGNGWSILVSCSPGEASFEDAVRDDRAGGHSEQGIFTASLVSGLMGGALADRNEPVGLLELASYVCQRVEAESKLMIQSQLASERSGSLGATLLHPQHPVLLSSGALSLGGPLRVVLAPERARSKQDLRRRWPSREFAKYLRRFLLGSWPIDFSRKMMFRECGAVLYGGAMLLTFLWFLPISLGGVRVPFALTAAIGSGVLWWFMVALAVAANEDGWHAGGYANGIFVFSWHGLLFAGHQSLLRLFPDAFQHVGHSSLLLFVDLLVLASVVVIFGCNASQAIIALAETVRRDERQEIRQAVQVFRQFRTRRWHVDLFNLIAMVSARPDVYFYALLVVVGLVALDLVHIGLRFSEAPNIWIIVLRDIFLLVLVCWQTFWYAAAFQRIQREVDRR